MGIPFRQKPGYHIFWPCDLDLWPTTLPYNPNLATVKVNYHTKNQGRRSHGLAVRVFTGTHTQRKTAPILWPRPLTREVPWTVQSYYLRRQQSRLYNQSYVCPWPHKCTCTIPIPQWASLLCTFSPISNCPIFRQLRTNKGTRIIFYGWRIPTRDFLARRKEKKKK